MLDSTLLNDFMNGYFGHGELSADYWFIGMESGGGRSEREVAERLRSWDNLGRQPVVDNLKFHEAVHNERGEPLNYLFEGRVKIQRTWAGLIRILLAAQGQTDLSASAVRAVQSSSWGREGSDNCLLELLPLPSPGVSKWFYDQWSDLPVLQSREKYRDYFWDSRTQKLRELIQENKPRCVIFYSVSADYLLRWSQIAGVDFNELELEEVCKGNQGQSFKARFYENKNTLYAAIYHPVYTGLTKEYFAKVGGIIRQRIIDNV